MANYQAGTAYIQVIPSLKGFSQRVKGELAGMDINVTGRVTVDVDRASMAAVEARVQQLEDKLTAARNKEADASSALAVAERKLQETRARYAADSSQVLAAEERLTSVQRKLTEAHAAATRATEAHAAAEQKLRDAATRGGGGAGGDSGGGAGGGGGGRDGAAYGGAFGDAARRRIEAALTALPAARVSADASDADRNLQGIRDQLVALSSQRIGIDLDASVAAQRIAQLRAELDGLRNSPNVDVRVNAAAAAAELARVQAEIDRVDGRHAEAVVDVTDRGSADQASAGLGRVMAVGLKFGTLVPLIGGVGAALLALSGPAAVAAGGLGTLVLGFAGIGKAVGAMNDQQTTAAADARTLAGQQAAAADAVASAQDRLGAAIKNVTTVRLNNADAAIRSAQAVANAQQQVANQEKALADAQRAAVSAQQALTSAREAARRGLQDLAFQVADGALQQRSAVLQYTSAKQALDSALADPSASAVARQQAQLTFDQAAQQLTELQVRNDRLAADKAAADARGVDGSAQVVAAQDQVRSTTDRVAAAQQSLANAQQGVANALREQANQQRQAADANLQAQQQVVDSQRALAAALRQSGDVGAASMDKINQAMADLSPAGQAFAVFLAGLKPVLDGLKATAQAGLLPGVQAGIEALLPVMPVITTVVGQLAAAMGGLFQAAGQALASPFWVQFFTMLGSTAGPIMQQFGALFGQVAVFVAQLITNLMPLAPVAFQVLGVLMSGLSALLPFIGPVVDLLANGLLVGLQALLPAMAPFGAAMAALAGPVGALAAQLGGVLSAAVQALAPVVIALAPPLTSLISIIGGALVGVINTLAPLLPPLAGFIGALAMAVGGALQSAMAAIMPVLSQVVGALGIVLVQALGALMPLLPVIIDAFLMMVQALLPIVPPLLQIVMALLPPLIGLIPSLVPLIVMIAEAFGLILPQLAPLITQLAGSLIPIINDLMPLVNMVFTGIVQIISWALSTIVVPLLQNVVVPAIRILADVITWLLDNIVRPVFSALGAVISWVWQNVIMVAFDAIRNGIDNVGKGFESAVGFIQRVWDRMKEIAAVPVNFVIETVYNQGILKLWNNVADFLGLKDMKLQPMQPVRWAGGGVVPGYAPGRDVVHSLLSPGEAVLVPEAVRAIGPENILALNRSLSGRAPTIIGGNGFSGGGVVPRFAGGGLIGNIADWVGGIGSSVVDLFTDPLGWMTRTFGGDNMSTWARGVFEAPVQLIGKVSEWAWQKIKEWIGIGGGGGGAAGNADLATWIRTAMKVAGVGDDWFGPLRTLIMRESSGNPKAINLTDINAQQGHPSQGLMQTIPSTFAAYRDPRLPNDITDPIANIVAGINYIRGRYGSIYNVQQAVGATPMGYDQGGWLPPGVSTVYNGLGKPEAVLTPAQLEVLAGQRNGGLDALDGLPIVGTLDLGDGLEARMDARITLRADAVGTAITTRRR